MSRWNICKSMDIKELKLNALQNNLVTPSMEEAKHKAR